MDERAALDALATSVPAAGDDCAVVDGSVLTTDMLHETTDFPDGTTRYTAGWRAVGASLSDVAAMGAEARAAVAVYAAPELDERGLRAFVDGARDVCEVCRAEYVGGDLDTHDEFTTATTALGRTDDPVLRSGAAAGEAVCVTGRLGRSGAALRLFDGGEHDRANDLFRFTPRVAAGEVIAPHAGAMMDVSDGLARSLHQLAAASDCGFAVDTPLPVADVVQEIAADPAEQRELSVFFGEDFELLFTVPERALDTAREAAPVDVSRIGTVVESGVTLDGDPLDDRGYTHG
ncbi:thiamine-phosphate kinase [Halococcus agarilyticus]|uniref:thiamine-phosphate kinase n=1 Tax=Halococcus agarilyticus TaxID=1232219 RepID=UPI000677FBDE|nr:thiamine-phosphate kinase [Halococcus agarilyticus]